MTPSAILNMEDTSHLDKVLKPNGFLEPVAAAVLREIPQMHLMLWCHVNAIYGLPTIELIDHLKTLFIGTTIEIGAGDGAFGRALGIKSTDSYVQASPEMKAFYRGIGQPPVNYGDNVLQFDALDAVQHFKPTTVFASWVTQYVSDEDASTTAGCYAGVKELEIAKHIKRYVLFGNHAIHGDKKLFKSPHLKKVEVQQSPLWFSRSSRPEQNALWIMDFE